MKKLAAVLLIVGLLGGCVSLGVWKPEVEQKLDQWGDWADKWVGGALSKAPTLIALVSKFAPSKYSAELQAASDAVIGAQDALGLYHGVVASGSGDPEVAKAGVQLAIDKLNATMSTVGKIGRDLGVDIQLQDLLPPAA